MSVQLKATRARALRITAVVVIAALGLIGLIIPILPGIPLLIVAGVLIGSRLPVERRYASALPPGGFEQTRVRVLRGLARTLDRRR